MIAKTESEPVKRSTNEEFIDTLLDKIKKQSLEIASLNARNAMLSLDRRELAENLSESAREHDRRGNVQLAMKHKEVVKRVMK